MGRMRGEEEWDGFHCVDGDGDDGEERFEVVFSRRDGGGAGLEGWISVRLWSGCFRDGALARSRVRCVERSP